MLPAPLAVLVNMAEPVESIYTMEQAAVSRWLDAIAIAVERPNDALACAYLLGYVVECTLKAALGKVAGRLPSVDLWTAVVRNLSPSARHDLNGLLDACHAARLSSPPPLSPSDESVWRARVGAVADSFAVTFRYKSFPVSATALASTYRDVEWIVEHAPDLWT